MTDTESIKPDKSYDKLETAAARDLKLGSLWRVLIAGIAGVIAVSALIYLISLQFEEKDHWHWKDDSGAFPSGIIALSFDESGNRLNTVGEDQVIRVFDLREDKQVREFELADDTGEVKAAAFSSNAARVLVSSGDFTTRILETHSGEVVCSWPGRGADFLGGGNRIAMRCSESNYAGGMSLGRISDQYVAVRDIDTGREIAKNEAFPEGCSRPQTSTGRDGVLFAGQDGIVHLWIPNQPTKSAQWNIESDKDEGIGAEFANGGETVVVRDALGRFVTFDASTKKEKAAFKVCGHCEQFTLGGSRPKKTFAWSVMPVAGGREALTLGGAGTFIRWDLNDRRILERRRASYWAGVFRKVVACALTPDGKHFVAPQSKHIAVYDAKTLRCTREFQVPLQSPRCLAVSHSGQLVLSGDAEDDHGVRIWKFHTGELLHTMTGHDDKVVSVAFSSDDTLALSCTIDGNVRLWNVANGSIRSSYSLPDSEGVAGYRFVASLHFLPNGIHAVCVADKDALIFDVRSGSIVHRLEHGSDLIAVNCSPDGTRLATGGESDDIRLWDATTGKPLSTIKAPGGVASLAFGMEGNTLLGGSADGLLRSWKVPGGEPIAPFEVHSGGLTCDAFARHADRGITGGGDGVLRYWDLAGGRCLNRLTPFDKSGVCCALSPDGKYALAAGEVRKGEYSSDYIAVLWDTSQSEVLRRHDIEYSDIELLGFSFDGAAYFIGHEHGVVKLFDRETGEQRSIIAHATPEHPYPEIMKITMSQDGRLLATAIATPSKRYVCVWDLESEKMLYQVPGFDAGFSPDGKHLCISCEDAALRLWDCLTGKLIRRLDGHVGDLRYLAVSDDGTTAVAAEFPDANVTVWDVETGTVRRKFRVPKHCVDCVAISGDGTMVLAAEDRHVSIWNVETGKAIYDDTLTFTESPSSHLSIEAAAFSSDGKTIVTGDDDETVRVWRLPDLSEQHAMKQHCQEIVSLCVSPDDRFAASVSDDKTLFIWDVKSGKRVHKFVADGGLESVVFSPDGQKAAVGDGIGRVEVWRLPRE